MNVDDKNQYVLLVYKKTITVHETNVLTKIVLLGHPLKKKMIGIALVDFYILHLIVFILNFVIDSS